MEQQIALKIGIIGAGFSGTAFAAALSRLTNKPLEIFLFEKSGVFGTGSAYSTPFPFHLLNVRAQDMSAFEDDPNHFVDWIKENPEIHAYLDQAHPIEEQFLPRLLYGNYLKTLLTHIHSPGLAKIFFEPHEVLDIIPKNNQALLCLSNQKKVTIDKIILAFGNNLPSSFPFSVSPNMKCINNPWDYEAPLQIPKKDPVLIIGTGLSMIDAVLTLHHEKHQGPIYAVSRHGLLPLPHSDTKVSSFQLDKHLPKDIKKLTQYLRKKSLEFSRTGGDWRSVINALRPVIPSIWQNATAVDKKRFLRHVLPYWNVHRHRVHKKIADLLADLIATKKLNVMSGRVIEVNDEAATIQLRQKNKIKLKVNCLINCMGPSLKMSSINYPFLNSLFSQGKAVLDDIDLGFNMSAYHVLNERSGKPSSLIYALGPPARGASWECSAVPEIRKQGFKLAQHLLNTE